MKVIVDMNIPVSWDWFLKDAGFESIHCCDLKERPVRDVELMERAREMGAVVFAHELDFGAVLELAGQNGPSVFQVVARDIMVPQIGPATVRALREFEEQLEKGALVLVDIETSRARVVSIPIAGGD